MTLRIALLLAAAFVLAGCSDQDWNHALSFVGVGSGQNSARAATPATTATAAARPAPAPVAAPAPQAAPQPNQFCASVASQDAQGSDFDPPTQSRVFVQSYQQCVTIFGDVAK